MICIGKQSVLSTVRSSSMADRTCGLGACTAINGKQSRTLNPGAAEYIPVNYHSSGSPCGFFYYQQHPPAISVLAYPYTIFSLPRPPPPCYFPHISSLTPPSHCPQFIPPPPPPPRPQPVTQLSQQEPESRRLLEKAQAGGGSLGSLSYGSKRRTSRGGGVWKMKCGSSSEEPCHWPGKRSRNRAVKASAEDVEEPWRMVKYRACAKRGMKFEIEPVEKSTRRTTVMIRNIPSRYTREVMLSFLDWHCMEVNQKQKSDGPQEGVEAGGMLSAYDFFYMPMDFKTGLNKSYAFVNFTSPEAVWRFNTRCDGQKWELFRSNKTRQIALAKRQVLTADTHPSLYGHKIDLFYLQGIKELIEHFGKTVFECRSDEFLPIHFQPPRDGHTDTVPILVGKRVSKFSRHI
uniref:Mei2-like C-terminal RNA recognition motif domain-containing protein n=1 Tax=Kalanchoe fedtschenkoi TaxID=63787 RepID=A0A7N0VAB9_KALFE